MAIVAKSANPWWRRLHHAWLALAGRQRHKSNQTLFVDFDGLRIKQVAFPDSAEAGRVELLLRETDALGLFPGFVFRLENTVWVHFVPGHKPGPGTSSDIAAMTGFFSRLYQARPVQRRLEQTDLHARLLEHLRVLAAVGRLDGERVSALEELAERIRPEQVWMGLDYIDALAKNFIISDGRAVGIDIEAIHDGLLLGMGLAKARYRWLDEQADSMIEQLGKQGGPDLRPQWAHTRLVFLASYGVQNLMRGKTGKIQVDAYDALLGEKPYPA